MTTTQCFAAISHVPGQDLVALSRGQPPGHPDCGPVRGDPRPPRLGSRDSTARAPAVTFGGKPAFQARDERVHHQAEPAVLDGP